jgi:excisionase family DNA binding protein
MATRSVYDSVYKVNEVARIFRLTPRVVRALIRDGELPAIRLGGHYRVPRSVIDAVFTQPLKTSFTPEDLGFGLWKPQRGTPDSVARVNRIRNRNKKTLKETVAELDAWHA